MALNMNGTEYYLQQQQQQRQIQQIQAIARTPRSIMKIIPIRYIGFSEHQSRTANKKKQQSVR